MATAEGYDPAVWRQLSEDLALPGIHVPEQYGGAGFGMVELCIVTEELGRALLCAPYFSSAVLAANAILNAGTDAQKSALLPDIAKGARLATLAITEPDGNWDPAGIKVVATPDSDGYRLDGVKSFVVDGHVAKLLIVAARAPKTTGLEGLALFTLDANAAGVERRLLESMDPTRKITRIDFRGAHANLLGNLDDGAEPILRTLDRAAIALANEMVGGAQIMLDSAVNYAKLRVQFGRTIGSFQAIKHKLANMYVAVESARATAYFAAAAIAEADDRRDVAVAMAKASVGDCQKLVTTEGIQCLGGIGYTWEHDMHLYVKRAKAGAALFGTGAEHLERLSHLLGL